MRRLFRAIGIERGRHVDQILDSELDKKLKESEKIILPQKEVLAQDKEEWLLIKQEFLIRNMLHEEIQFVKDLLMTQRVESLKPLQEAHKIWTDNCNLKPLLANIKEQLVTYQDQYKRRLKEEKDTLQTFSMEDYNYEMCQLDLQKRTLQNEIELTEKAINLILNGQLEHLIQQDPETMEDGNNIGQNLQILNRKLKMINHDQVKIENQIVGLENEIDLFNEGHFIKSGFIQNGSKILEIIRSINNINLIGNDIQSSETALSRRYWFFNCQHQTTEKKREQMMKSIQTFEQLKPTKYSPSSHGYIASANYLREQISLAFTQKETSKLNESIKDSKSLILLNLNNLMSPGLQLNYESNQNQIQQHNIKKMDLMAKFNYCFHEIIQLSKKQTSAQHTKTIIQTLENCNNQEEQLARLNALIQAKTTENQRIDALKIQAYNQFRQNESIRNLVHLIESLQDQIRWRQKVEDIRQHLEKQMGQIDKFFEKRTAKCLSKMDRDLALLFNRNKQMASDFKKRGLVEFHRLDEQFERQFLRMNFGRVQGFQELQNIFELSQGDRPQNANQQQQQQQPNNQGVNANPAAQNNNNNQNMPNDMDEEEMAFFHMMHRDRDGEFEMMDELEDMMEMRRARFRRPAARRIEFFNHRMRVDDGNLNDEIMFMGEPMAEPLQPREQQPMVQEQPHQLIEDQIMREQPPYIFNFDIPRVRNEEQPQVREPQENMFNFNNVTRAEPNQVRNRQNNLFDLETQAQVYAQAQPQVQAQTQTQTQAQPFRFFQLNYRMANTTANAVNPTQQNNQEMEPQNDIEQNLRTDQQQNPNRQNNQNQTRPIFNFFRF